MTAEEILDTDFLAIRHGILNLAACFDRAGRAEGSETLTADARWIKIKDALTLLLEERTDHAERVQMLFSESYRSDWRKQSS